MLNAKKMGTGILTASMAVIIAGCGASTTPSASAASKHVAITFEGSLVRGPYSPYMKTIVSNFEKQNPDITVTLVGQPSWMVLHAALATALAGGSPPTLAQVENSWVPRYASAGALVPLNSFIKGSAGLSMSQIHAFWPEIWKQQSLSGKTWMMPFAVSDTVLYYNASWLKKAHLPLPTSQQLLASDMKAVVSHSQNTWGISMDPGTSSAAANGTFWFISLLRANGGHIFQGGKIAWDSAAGISAMRYLQKLYQDGAIKLGTNYPGQAAICSNHALFDISSTTSYPYLKKAEVSPFSLQALPLPAGLHGSGNVSTGFNLAIFSSATPAQQKAAWLLMKFINTSANQAYWSKNTSYLPSTSASMATLKSVMTQLPSLKPGSESLRYAKALPSHQGMTQILGNLSKAIEEVLLKNQAPATALRSSAQAAQQLLTP